MKCFHSIKIYLEFLDFLKEKESVNEQFTNFVSEIMQEKKNPKRKIEQIKSIIKEIKDLKKYFESQKE